MNWSFQTIGLFRFRYFHFTSIPLSGGLGVSGIFIPVKLGSGQFLFICIFVSLAAGENINCCEPCKEKFTVNTFCVSASSSLNGMAAYKASSIFSFDSAHGWQRKLLSFHFINISSLIP